MVWAILRLATFGFIGYFIIASIMPTGTPVADIEKLGTVVFIDSPVGIFEYFLELHNDIAAINNDDYNPLQDWIWMLGFLATIALVLALPVLWVLGAVIIIWAMIHSLSQALAQAYMILLTGSDGRPESAQSKVFGHLVTGRITIDESIKNDAAAQAIVAALDARDNTRESLSDKLQKRL